MWINKINNNINNSNKAELVNIISVMFYNFIEFIILLYTFLVIYFDQYIECIISQVLFSKFSGVLSAFSCENAIGNFWKICLRDSILRCEQSETSDMRANIPGSPFPWVVLN